ncbi:MAG: class I SAM-dependent methyltransferase [Oligoflexia bacterium]|nr:class I SAM-dependent methyltransferase [Oligoflexia bacterium]
MILHRFKDAYVLDKPAGVATHSPDSGATRGFIEMASQLLGQELWAVHRLDKETSGCLLVTTSAQAVEAWTKKLAEAKKKYVFLSPKESEQSLWSYEGRIEKTGNHRFELVPGPANSHTKFAKLGRVGLGFLYEAEISTGKTHQIRLHAEECGVPILGDLEHGKIPWPRMALHSHVLMIDKTTVTSPLPHCFNASDIKDTDLIKLLASFDRRRFLINFETDRTDCFRIVHREWTAQAKLTVEKLGPCLQFLNYTEGDPPEWLIKNIAQALGCSHFSVRDMINRGKSESAANISYQSPDHPETWVVAENKMKFELRLNQGMSSGLFLDQRDNRNRVLHSSEGLRVANFFSYTCGFSVAAALGGAHDVVSIDTSTSSLEWGKKNFEINGLNPEQFEFFTADSRFFLESCRKRERQFDLIILDPPTFSRSKLGGFQLSKDLPDLLQKAFKVLSPHGRMLVTTNDETVRSADLGRTIESVAQTLKLPPLLLEKVVSPYDFEFPLERNTVLKGFWITLS